MKKISKVIGLILVSALAGTAIFTLAPSPKLAHANTFTPPWKQLDTAATVNVAAGAQIQTVVTDFSACDDVEVLAENSLGASSRTLNIDWIAYDLTTVLYRRAVTVTNGTRQAIAITRFASAQSAGTNETVIGQMPGTHMQFTLTAAGAAVGSLVVYCR